MGVDSVTAPQHTDNTGIANPWRLLRRDEWNECGPTLRCRGHDRARWRGGRPTTDRRGCALARTMTKGLPIG